MGACGSTPAAAHEPASRLGLPPTAVAQHGTRDLSLPKAVAAAGGIDSWNAAGVPALLAVRTGGLDAAAAWWLADESVTARTSAAHAAEERRCLPRCAHTGEERTHLLRWLQSMCQATTVEAAAAEVRAIMSLGHLLWAYAYMRMLYARAPDVYYGLLLAQPAMLMPVVYTPTVGEACQKFGLMPFYNRGCCAPCLSSDAHARPARCARDALSRRSVLPAPLPRGSAHGHPRESALDSCGSTAVWRWRWQT